jgi:hypothetical protein
MVPVEPCTIYGLSRDVSRLVTNTLRNSKRSVLKSVDNHYENNLKIFLYRIF